MLTLISKNTLGLTVSLLVLLFVFSESIIIGPAKSGVVYDYETSRPISDIPLLREIEEYRGSSHGPIGGPIRRDVTSSDREGRFYFPGFILWRIPFTNESRELLYVNPSHSFRALPGGDDIDVAFNINYEEVTLGFGFGPDQPVADQRSYGKDGYAFIPFKNHVVVPLKSAASAECFERSVDGACAS